MSVNIILEDVQGRQQIQPAGQTLASTLASLRLPHTMFQAYLVRPGHELLPIPHWTTLESLDGAPGHVLLCALRNTLFDTRCCGRRRHRGRRRFRTDRAE